jgi:hypothetical protein
VHVLSALLKCPEGHEIKQLLSVGYKYLNSEVASQLVHLIDVSIQVLQLFLHLLSK